MELGLTQPGGSDQRRFVLAGCHPERRVLLVDSALVNAQSLKHLLASHQCHPPQPGSPHPISIPGEMPGPILLGPGRDTSPWSPSDGKTTRSCEVVNLLPDRVTRVGPRHLRVGRNWAVGGPRNSPREGAGGRGGGDFYRHDGPRRPRYPTTRRTLALPGGGRSP